MYFIYNLLILILILTLYFKNTTTRTLIEAREKTRAFKKKTHNIFIFTINEIEMRVIYKNSPRVRRKDADRRLLDLRQSS